MGGIGIFDGIEKLINEHGSAEILGQRLLLAKDQNTVQEKRISELVAQGEKAQTENAALRLQLQQSQDENRKLQTQINESHNTLTFKYSVFWDKDGNPYCPNCQKPTLQIKWASHLHGQVHGLKCSCTPKAFVLLDNGQPIQAEDAIKLMCKSNSP